MPKLDLSNYEGGREPALVKHSLLETYLPDLVYRVGRTWDSFAYVDGFAGPWKTQDPTHADSSFAIAVDALRQAQVGLRNVHGREIHVTCILVEQNNVAFAELERFASRETTANFEVHAIHGEFINTIPAIDQIAKGGSRDPFKFVLLDPTGWAQVPMEKLKSFLNERSSEVLVTLMIRDINRFLGEEDRAESYRQLFGRPGVLERLRNTSEDRAEQAVLEYSQSLKELCNFKHVSAAVVLEPNKESIRYFLVYGTKHHRGIEVFKAAEMKAAMIQDDVRHEAHIQKTRQPDLAFDSDPPKSRKALALQSRYAEIARKKVVALLAANTNPAGVEYKDLFCEAMFFPLVTPSDLVGWLEALEPGVEIQLAGLRTRRKPKPSEDFRAVVINPKVLAQA
ncbi:MAG: three-Cys-motif partner protein TcmP [Pyrinomonadaceae bacterium]|nr:three-Cys-motif partner protein TcmP [Pyrinomonadaceae bacterium]